MTKSEKLVKVLDVLFEQTDEDTVVNDGLVTILAKTIDPTVIFILSEDGDFNYYVFSDNSSYMY